MPFDWSDILEALEHDECILLLGPHAATYESNSLHNLLTERFALKLGVLKGKDDDKQLDLSMMIKLFMDQFKDPTDALNLLGKTLRDFYAEYDYEDIPIYDLLSQLPFKYIINTSPDNLLKNRLNREGKSCRFFDFNYNKPEYNAGMNRNAIDLDGEINVDSPLLFNLLGHFDRPDSLVLTNNHKLQFLEVALQRNREATLPANITYFFTSPPLQRLRKSYIFLGFDFNEWHMRLLIHLLGRSHGKILPQTVSLQSLDTLSGDTQTFFTDNFNMHFVGDEPQDFLKELQKQLKKDKVTVSNKSLEVLFLFHPADKALLDEMEVHLATLQRDGKVNIWHQNKMMPGDQEKEVMLEHLKNAKIIIPLITANFLADDWLSATLLPLALQLDEARQTKLTPIVMSPCDVKYTPLFQLNSLYPRPKGSALSQKKDRDEAIRVIIDDLRATIENISAGKSKDFKP